MTVSLFVKHQVKDFDTWKKLYDENAQLRKDNGVIADSVHSSLEDPSSLMIYHQFADANALEAFTAMFDTDEIRELVVGQMGVLPETMEMWAGEDA